MTYEIGVEYIWQNQVGEMAYLNGIECTVVGAPSLGFDVISQSYAVSQETDTFCPDPQYYYFASAGDLRRKQPPTGLATVLAWFTAPAPREVETA